MNRREFIKGLAAAGFPLVVPSSVLGGDGTTAPSNRINYALIGCGSRRGRMDGQLVALCDPWKNRRERLMPQVKGYGDFREVMARDDVDAVVIATPDHWHVPITMAAARAGKDVFCEKPLGLTIVQDLACRAAVKRYGTVFQYGTQRRWSQASWLAANIVRSGRLGEVREIIAGCDDYAWHDKPGPVLPVPADLDYDMWLGPAPWVPYRGWPTGGRGWYGIYDYTIGFLSGWGAHPLDIVVYCYDAHRHGPWEVEGTAARHFNHPTVVATWKNRVQFGKGALLHFEAGRFRVRFVGTEGWLEWQEGRISSEPASIAASPLQRHEAVVPRHSHDFAQNIRTRGTPTSHIDDAVHSDIISHLCDIAIRLGRKVVWDPAAEKFVNDPDATRRMDRAMRAPWRL